MWNFDKQSQQKFYNQGQGILDEDELRPIDPDDISFADDMSDISSVGGGAV